MVESRHLEGLSEKDGSSEALDEAGRKRALNRPMPLSPSSSKTMETPVFIYDLRRLKERLDLFGEVHRISGVKVLYSIKAQPHAGLLRWIGPKVRGFSVSSLFEARLAREVLIERGLQDHPLHLTSPGLKLRDLEALKSLDVTISYNSLEQLQRCEGALALEGGKTGLRINPGLSSIPDPRYDPCRPRSKLGIPLEDLQEAINMNLKSINGVVGLHFHSHYEQPDAEPLRWIFERIEKSLGVWLLNLQWINIGGGYAPRSHLEAQALGGVIHSFRERTGLEILMEPGKGLVGAAGRLETTVIDLFNRDGKTIAVLDTGVHHLPEVFEYQRPPRIKEASPKGPHEALLVGSSCLAGDLFGLYRFEAPIKVGDRLTILDVGAYAMVKASRFNGFDFPDLVILDEEGSFGPPSRGGYEAYRGQWGLE